MSNTIKKLLLEIEIPKVKLCDKMTPIFRTCENFSITFPQRIPRTTFGYYCYVIVVNDDNIDRNLREVVDNFKKIPEFINCRWEQE